MCKYGILVAKMGIYNVFVAKMHKYGIFVAKMCKYGIFVAKMCKYGIFVAKIYKYALIDNFQGYAVVIDSSAYAALFHTSESFEWWRHQIPDSLSPTHDY